MKKSTTRSRRSPRKTSPVRATSYSQDFFQAILDASPELVFVVEAEGTETGKIIAVNSAASKRLGYSVSQLCRMKLADLDALSTPVSSSSLIARAASGQSATGEIERLRKDGHSLFFEVQAVSMNWQRKKRIVTFERDRLERRASDAQLRLYEMELSKLEEIDPLTERLNRHRFLELAEMEFQRYKRYDRHFAFVLVDIDHFRQINERFGSEIGDVALKFLALQITSQMRKNDWVGRLGAEEFGVLMPETTGEAACTVAERIRLACNGMTIQTRKGDLKLTISQGVTEVRVEDPSFISILKRADAAVQRAKDKGRDRVESA